MRNLANMVTGDKSEALAALRAITDALVAAGPEAEGMRRGVSPETREFARQMKQSSERARKEPGFVGGCENRFKERIA